MVRAPRHQHDRRARGQRRDEQPARRHRAQGGRRGAPRQRRALPRDRREHLRRRADHGRRGHDHLAHTDGAVDARLLRRRADRPARHLRGAPRRRRLDRRSLPGARRGSRRRLHPPRGARPPQGRHVAVGRRGGHQPARHARPRHQLPRHHAEQARRERAARERGEVPLGRGVVADRHLRDGRHALAALRQRALAGDHRRQGHRRAGRQLAAVPPRGRQAARRGAMGPDGGDRSGVPRHAAPPAARGRGALGDGRDRAHPRRGRLGHRPRRHARRHHRAAVLATQHRAPVRHRRGDKRPRRDHRRPTPGDLHELRGAHVLRRRPRRQPLQLRLPAVLAAVGAGQVLGRDQQGTEGERHLVG